MSPIFEKRLFSTNQIKNAGEKLRNIASLSPEEKELALKMLDNFRALHAAPLNTFQATLRKRLERLGIEEPIVAQRIKRKPTILDKLERFPRMLLSRMHDIGGIRAIVPSIQALDALYQLYTAPNKRVAHELVGDYDYVTSPKASGYRGRHLVFRYRSNHDKMKDYDGLRIEMQLRTQLQHTWATAVETFEAFMGENFKSSKGSQEWLDFFALASSAFALREKQAVLEAHAAMSAQDIIHKLSQLIKELDVIAKIRLLEKVTILLPEHVKQESGHALLVLDAETKVASVRYFTANEYDKAYHDYIYEEKLGENMPLRQTVLVRMDSISKLKRAYPNYFADLNAFLHCLTSLIK